MKRKVDQGDTQRAYVHSRLDSGSHIRGKERRPCHSLEPFATAEYLHCFFLHPPNPVAEVILKS